MIVSHKIAVISDTHNLMREEVIEHFKDCDAILHAGDIAKPEIIDELEKFAPLYLVRGNADKEWAEHIPYTLEFELYGKKFFMTHKKKDVPENVEADVVICGHSHKYVESFENERLFLNPGSCGPRRFTQPITMAILTIGEENNALEQMEEDDVHAANRIYRIYNDIIVERIDIPHDGKEKTISESEKMKVTTKIVEQVCTDVDKGKKVSDIAKSRNIDDEITEQIVRMYLTHPGVTPEGIMAKMGL